MASFQTIATSSLGFVLPIAAILVLLLMGLALHKLSAYLGESTQSKQAARLIDGLGSIADGIAETMMAHPPAPADVLAAVRAAAVAQGVAYAKSAFPATIGALGTSDAALATRLNNEVADVLNKAPAAAAVANALAPALPAIEAMAVPALEGALAGAAGPAVTEAMLSGLVGISNGSPASPATPVV